LRTYFSKDKQKDMFKRLNITLLVEQMFKGRSVDFDLIKAQYQPEHIKEEEFTVISALFKKTLMKCKIKFPIMR
jgi:hypothetical protein